MGDPVEVLLGADEAVPVFGLPEGAGLVEGLVDFSGGVALPGVDDVGNEMFSEWLEEDVDVVGHDDVACELIAVVVKMMEGPGDDFADAGFT